MKTICFLLFFSYCLFFINSLNAQIQKKNVRFGLRNNLNFPDLKDGKRLFSSCSLLNITQNECSNTGSLRKLDFWAADEGFLELAGMVLFPTSGSSSTFFGTGFGGEFIDGSFYNRLGIGFGAGISNWGSQGECRFTGVYSKNGISKSWFADIQYETRTVLYLISSIKYVFEMNLPLSIHFGASIRGGIDSDQRTLTTNVQSDPQNFNSIEHYNFGEDYLFYLDVAPCVGFYYGEDKMLGLEVFYNTRLIASENSPVNNPNYPDMLNSLLNQGCFNYWGIRLSFAFVND